MVIIAESSLLLVFSFREVCAIITLVHGGIAQLGERLNGIQEVMGSNPTISMEKVPFQTGLFHFILF